MSCATALAQLPIKPDRTSIACVDKSLKDVMRLYAAVSHEECILDAKDSVERAPSITINIVSKTKEGALAEMRKSIELQAGVQIVKRGDVWFVVDAPLGK
jgi:hypothetical protein